MAVHLPLKKAGPRSYVLEILPSTELGPDVLVAPGILDFKPAGAADARKTLEDDAESLPPRHLKCSL